MRKRSVLFFAILVLIVLNTVIGVYALRDTERQLTVAFLDVGQGDAIFIESPSGHQMLIDGGPDRSVLRQLPKVMGPFDRSIDVVVETHPDADHITGLSDVFARYRISSFLWPGIPNSTSETYALAAAVEGERNLIETLARRGMRIDLGRGAYVDVLYPDRDVSNGETNEGSVIVRVVYGETVFFLSGDASEDVEDYVVSFGMDIESEVLKAGHHGSRTSTGAALLAATSPDYVVVSAAEDNSYGHPHTEVLARIEAAGATMLNTAEEGTVVFVSDGVTVRER